MKWESGWYTWPCSHQNQIRTVMVYMDMENTCKAAHGRVDKGSQQRDATCQCRCQEQVCPTGHCFWIYGSVHWNCSKLSGYFLIYFFHRLFCAASECVRGNNSIINSASHLEIPLSGWICSSSRTESSAWHTHRCGAFRNCDPIQVVSQYCDSSLRHA